MITAGFAGVGAEVGTLYNELIQFGADPETIEKFIEAIGKQAENADPLSEQFVELQEQARKFGVELQDNVVPYLKSYAGLLTLSNEAMIKSVSFAGSVLAGGAREFTDEGGIKEGLGLEKLIDNLL